MKTGISTQQYDILDALTDVRGITVDANIIVGKLAGAIGKYISDHNASDAIEMVELLGQFMSKSEVQLIALRKLDTKISKAEFVPD